MISDLTEDNIRDEVVFIDEDNGIVEYGFITSFNDSFVFVRYDGNQHSEATSYDSLIWREDYERHS